MSKLPGLPTVAALGLIVMIAVALTVVAPFAENPAGGAGLTDWLYRWQTLIGSFGAIIAAWIAVRPVWRQVNYMGAQAALALLPTLRDREMKLAADLPFLSSCKTIDAALAQTSAQIDFGERAPADEVSMIAQQFISIRGYVDALRKDWPQFGERIELATRTRAIRLKLWNELEEIYEHCGDLVARQHHWDRRFASREEYRTKIADVFVSNACSLIDRHRTQLNASMRAAEADVLTQQEELRVRAGRIDAASRYVG